MIGLSTSLMHWQVSEVDFSFNFFLNLLYIIFSLILILFKLNLSDFWFYDGGNLLNKIDKNCLLCCKFWYYQWIINMTDVDIFYE